MSPSLAGVRLAHVADRDGRPRVGVVAGNQLELLDADDMVALLERDALSDVVDRVEILDDQSAAGRLAGPRARAVNDSLRRDNPIPAGTLLLTGTGIVPPDEVTLLNGMHVEIRIPGIGVLRNPVAGG